MGMRARTAHLGTPPTVIPAEAGIHGFRNEFRIRSRATHPALRSPFAPAGGMCCTAERNPPTFAAYRCSGTASHGWRVHPPPRRELTRHADRSHRGRYRGDGPYFRLARHRVSRQFRGADRGPVRCGYRPRRTPSGGVGPRRRRHRRQRRRPARAPGGGSRGDPAPPPPAPQGGAEGHRRGQDRLPPEADVHLHGGGRPPRHRRGSLGSPVQGVRELPVPSPGRPERGS